MRRVLLTGGDGQLGWEVARRAAAAGVLCRAAGRADLDITDRDAVRRMVGETDWSAVINAAAYTAVDRAETDAAAAYAVNRDGPAHLAGACAEAGVPLLHVSTDYVFDGSKAAPYREDDPVAPLGVYGASKLAGEEAVRSLCAQHIILRTAWVYGVHGHNFVKTMLRLGRERDRLRVVDDQRGCPTAAGDLADVLLTLAGRLGAGQAPESAFGTFHATGQGDTSWCGFARHIFALAETRLERIPAVDPITTADFPTPARRPANSVLDCDRLARVHGLRLRPWKDALAETLNSLLPPQPLPR